MTSRLLIQLSQPTVVTYLKDPNWLTSQKNPKPKDVFDIAGRVLFETAVKGVVLEKRGSVGDLV